MYLNNFLFCELICQKNYVTLELIVYYYFIIYKNYNNIWRDDKKGLDLSMCLNVRLIRI